MTGDWATTSFAATQRELRALFSPGFKLPHSFCEPDITADGRKGLVTGASLDELEGAPRTRLYLVDDESGLQPVLAEGSGTSRGGRFSPDDLSIAFLLDELEDGNVQLQIQQVGGRELRTTEAQLGGIVEYVRWSPDGLRVLFGVASPGADRAAVQGSGSTNISFDVNPGWYPRTEASGEEAGWRSTWVMSLDSGEPRRVSPDGINFWDADWCGSDTLIAVTSRAPSEDSWYRSELTRVDVATGTHERVLEPSAQLAFPSGSPDGQYVSVIQATCSDRGLVAGRVMIVSTQTGLVLEMDAIDADVTQARWIDDRRLGYLGLRGMDSVAGVIELPDASPLEVFSTSMSCGDHPYPDGAFTRDGRVFVARSSYDIPPELVLVGPERTKVLATTAHEGTQKVRSIGGGAERLVWTASDGTAIEGILCLPRGDGPHPLVVNVHGGPIYSFRETWCMGRTPLVPLLVSHGYAVLCPNPRGSSGRGQAFAQSVIGDMGGADAQDILAGVDRLLATGMVDRGRLGITGISYGGFMSAWLVGQDDRFAAAVPVSPVTNWFSQTLTSNIPRWGLTFLKTELEDIELLAARSPSLRAHHVRTPTLSVAGADDRCTPPDQAREFHRALSLRGVDSALAVYPGEGHGIRSYPAVIDYFARLIGWFEMHMPACATAPSPVAPSACDLVTALTTAQGHTTPEVEHARAEVARHQQS